MILRRKANGKNYPKYPAVAEVITKVVDLLLTLDEKHYGGTARAFLKRND